MSQNNAPDRGVRPAKASLDPAVWEGIDREHDHHRRHHRRPQGSDRFIARTVQAMRQSLDVTVAELAKASGNPCPSPTLHRFAASALGR
jgi:hypothetical protein